MDFLHLAWKNLWRNRRRTTITLAALSLSLMLVQAFHNLSHGVYGQMIASGVRAGSGHIAVYRGDYVESRNEKLSYPLHELPDEIRALPGVAHVLPRIYLPALAQSSRESRGIVLMGLEPRAEEAVNPFFRKLPSDQRLRLESRDALVGKRLLRELQIAIGSKFVITLQSSDGTLTSELFRVRGVLDTGLESIDTGTIMVSRERAAALGGIGGEVHELAVILARRNDDRRVLPALREMLGGRPRLQAVTWEKAMPNLANAIKLDYVSQKFIFIIILLIVTIGVVNTLLMSVMERLREFGVILAVGASPGQLRRMILSEALVLGLIALLAGSLFGALATWYLAEVGIDLRLLIPETLEFGGVVFDPVLRAAWDPVWMLQLAGYVVLLCLAASLYPAWRAGRIAPAEAMRHI